MAKIFHITDGPSWEARTDSRHYRPASLEDEGFIHASRAPELIQVANERFLGREDLVVVAIDEERVEAPVRYESLYDDGRVCPHIYGPLNLDAVQSVVPFPPGDDGRFTLPDDV